MQRFPFAKSSHFKTSSFKYLTSNNKKTIKYLAYILLIGTFLFLFFPRRIEYGILIDYKKGYSKFLIGDKFKNFKVFKKTLEKNTIIEFKYNIFFAYGFKKLQSIDDRIMLKGDKYYEFEKRGNIKLDENCYFYSIDKNNNLTLVNDKKIIVGKNNVKSYLSSNGSVKIILLSPLDYSNMRVAISTTNFNSIYHDKINIQALAPMKLYTLKDKFELNTPINSIISIEKREDYFEVTTPTITKKVKDRLYIKCDSMNINSILRGNPSFTPNYSGIFEISLSDKGLLIINEIDIEDYLTKVVPSEMPASSAPEALKCQAIAARTYAISDMLGNRFATLGFYVDDSISSQVYNNVYPHPNSTDAIKKTKGIIMTYNNLPIDAKYYSTSAGTGIKYADVWFRSDGSSENKPYLTENKYITSSISLPTNEKDWLKFYKDDSILAYDSISPYFRWQIKFTSYQLTSILNKTFKEILDKRADFIVIKENSKPVKTLPNLKNLKEIKSIKRSAGGNLLQISFLFENAEVIVSGDSNIRNSIKLSQDYYATQTSVKLHNGNILNNIISIPSSFFSIEKTNNVFTIYGGGYGHGVGMSQHGAMELAKTGMDYKSILNTFYKNIDFENISVRN